MRSFLRSVIVISVFASGFTSVGCRSRHEDYEPVDPPAPRPALAPASGDRFAQLRKGMTMLQVTDLLGDPTSSDGHVMGKAFNPFYFGKDRYRRTWYYAGEGRLIFNIRSRLLQVINDPSEDGYPPPKS